MRRRAKGGQSESSCTRRGVHDPVRSKRLESRTTGGGSGPHLGEKKGRAAHGAHTQEVVSRQQAKHLHHHATRHRHRCQLILFSCGGGGGRRVP